MQNTITLDYYSYTILLFITFYSLYVLYKLLRKLKNKSLLNRNRTLKKLKRLSWDDFELLTMELFVKLGWNVRGNSKKGADGGVDIWMTKRSWGRDTLTSIVQCKRYDETKVTIKLIREMYGLMHEHEVDEVYIVTTSTFTKECFNFVQSKKIKLIDGNTLVDLINKVS